MKLENLKISELIDIGGGHDSCPMEKDKPLGYYIGYVVGWLGETIAGGLSKK